MRRMGSMLYELLVITALWMLASAIATSVLGKADTGMARLLLQLLSISIISAYFIWCWSHGGQTLAMRTWQIRLINSNGRPVSTATALRRFLLAATGICLAGIGLWWALLDKEGAFLHDRLGHTRLVFLKRT